MQEFIQELIHQYVNNDITWQDIQDIVEAKELRDTKIIANEILAKLEIIIKQLSNLQEQLDQVQNDMFILQMVDHWDASDYRYSDKLNEKERNIKSQIEIILKGGE